METSHFRALLKSYAVALFLSCLMLTFSGATFAVETFTQWGWPQPYAKISQKSEIWLKSKGWWPLRVAFQAPWSGQNTVNIVIDKMDLLAKRGVDAKFTAFASGPDINESLVSGRYQVGSGGNFPFTSLIDKGIPVKAIAIESPNLLHATIVPLDSQYKSLADMKGSNPPASIGLVTGSSGEFYFQMAAKNNGLVIGKDVIMKNMSPADQLTMPKGLSAVVSWDPTASLIVDERKTGRIIDSIFPHNMYEGQFYVRNELIENVPDVVQALSDSFLEATLWQRLYPEKAAQLLKDDPHLSNYSYDFLLHQVELYSNLYKPTYVYPNGEFWGKVNTSIFSWLYDQKRITHPLTAKDFVNAVDASFMRNSFKRLGWAIPKVPPFIPSGWAGEPDKVPYPEYLTPLNMKAPQAFPEKGDLVGMWEFNGVKYEP